MNARSEPLAFGAYAEPMTRQDTQSLLARIGGALRDRPQEPEVAPPPPPAVDVDAAMAAIARKMKR